MIRLEGTWETREVLLDGERLDPGKSQALRNHSPDGFCWGYGGSGPAQLALAVLLEAADAETALKSYQEFKWEVISELPRGDFSADISLDRWCPGVQEAQDAANTA